MYVKLNLITKRKKINKKELFLLFQQKRIIFDISTKITLFLIFQEKKKILIHLHNACGNEEIIGP